MIFSGANQYPATIHNNTLYIDGGKETFIDINKAGEQSGNITIGYSTVLSCYHPGFLISHHF